MVNSNKIKAEELFKEGYSKSEIARQLNISRERVRQFLMGYVVGWKGNERICSYCDSSFIPKHKYQATCCNRSIPEQTCSICGDQVSIAASKLTPTKIVSCSKLECQKERNIRVRAKLRNVAISCYACGEVAKTTSHILNKNGKARCSRCVSKQYVARCHICGQLITSKNERRVCRTHIKFGKILAYSDSSSK